MVRAIDFPLSVCPQKSLCMLVTKSMEVDDNILLIVRDPQGILDWQFIPGPIHLINIIIINYISLNHLKAEDHPVFRR